MPRVTESDEVFKKREQVVDRPKTTEHNINDEYVRNPPHNAETLRDTHWHPSKESTRESTAEEDQATLPEAVGRRVTPLEDMATTMREDAVMPGSTSR